MDEDRYPGPFQRMRPAGLPGLFVVLFVTFGIVTLFVSRNVADVLLWVMVGVILVVAGFSVYRAIAGRR